MATVEFLPFATQIGANVESQSDYAIDPKTGVGHQAGIASSAAFNKAMRQGNFVAAAIAKFVSQRLDENVLDNGDLDAFIAQFLAAIISTFPKQKISSDVTYYVDPTGSDTNPGTALLPFRTIQHAYDIINNTIDLSGHRAIIQLADGTYTSPLHAYGVVAGSTVKEPVTLVGNAGNPWNVIIHPTGDHCITAEGGAGINVESVKLDATALVIGGGGLVSLIGSSLKFSNVVFGDCDYVHIWANQGGIGCYGDYYIDGTTLYHASAQYGGIITLSDYLNPHTTHFSGALRTFTTFADCSTLGMIIAPTTTFDGTCNGQRYFVQSNGIINTGGGGPNYFPGSIAGATFTGGQYL